jgi:hypothetical protein
VCVCGGGWETLGLTIETIDLSDLSALMVSSQENHFIRVHGLQSKELSKGLQTVVASVHKVPHKHVGCAWDFSSRLKQLLQVIEL